MLDKAPVSWAEMELPCIWQTENCVTDPSAEAKRSLDHRTHGRRPKVPDGRRIAYSGTLPRDH